MPSPGPKGKPSRNQITNNTVHIIAKKIEYGNRAEINVPIPMFLSYLRANARRIAKYASIGVIGFVMESPTR